MSFKETSKKIWNFIWHDNSIWSWIVNVILAFILVRWVIYPLIGFLLSTSFPIVAVVSGSMEHNGMNFDTWWEENHNYYEDIGISKENFEGFSFKNGFNTGDIMILKGMKPKDIKVGDVVVYVTSRYSNPIIHRVVEIQEKEGKIFFVTKGDNNITNDSDPVSEEQIRTTGKAIGRIPWLGWLKIILVDWIRGG